MDAGSSHLVKVRKETRVLERGQGCPDNLRTLGPTISNPLSRSDLGQELFSLTPCKKELRFSGTALRGRPLAWPVG